MLVLIIIIYTIPSVAQKDYYYYKGNKIPLYMNNNKVCVSILKSSQKSSEKILADVKVQDKIFDESFDISIISHSDYDMLTRQDSWKEDSKSVIKTTCFYTADGTEVFTSPYIIVRLINERDLEYLYSYAELFGLKIIGNDPLMPLWYILSITQDSDISTLECANKLWESGYFAASVPDLCSEDYVCSYDPLYSSQWGLHNSIYTGIDISADSAWLYSTGKDVKIAIFDTGVDLDHIDLSPNISNLSYDTDTNTSPSVFYRDHGTHCAGIAAAVKDNGIKIAGVAPEATIVSISNSLSYSTFNSLRIADGFIWAYQHDVDIISNSWHSPSYSPVIEEAIQDAINYGRDGKGCVIVFAAGNNGRDSVSFPANCNDAILVVGSINNTGVRASSSNYGAKLDIMAPGVDIISTLPDDQAGYKSGTSMACPHVAGVAALILERNPELSVYEVNSLINNKAKKIPGVSFDVVKQEGLWNNEYGYGLVDSYGSVINTPSIMYIQNDTITGTKVVAADYIVVGEDVTNTIEYGGVILGQGDITLKARYTKIKNSTFVPLGTTFKINNQ